MGNVANNLLRRLILHSPISHGVSDFEASPEYPGRGHFIPHVVIDILLIVRAYMQKFGGNF